MVCTAGKKKRVHSKLANSFDGLIKIAAILLDSRCLKRNSFFFELRLDRSNIEIPRTALFLSTIVRHRALWKSKICEEHLSYISKFLLRLCVFFYIIVNILPSIRDAPKDASAN